MKTLSLWVCLAAIAAVGCGGKVRVEYRRVELTKPKKDEPGPVAKRVPGQRRQGFKSTAYMLVGNELKRVTTAGPMAIKANEHYASVAIEEVRIWSGGLEGKLALVVRVGGALPTAGADLQAVVARAKKPDDDKYFAWRNPLLISPFVYRGHPVAVEISLTNVSEGLARQIDEAKKTWGDARHIDPYAPAQHPIDASKLEEEGSEWLRAAFATLAETASLPLVAGRYVVFSHANPDEIASKITFDVDKGLVWKDGGEAVKGTSFATFVLNRRFRGPRRMDMMLEQMKRTIDGAINGGGLDTAKSALQKLPDLIDKEAQVTNLEKELNRSLAKYYELRIARKTAKEAKDKAALATATDELLKFVEEMMKKHKDLLEPAEVSDFQTRMRRYRFERDL